MAANDTRPWEGWSEMKLFDAVFTPRATRIYENRPLPQDVLAKILRAGTFACSSGNTQPWEFVVVTDGDLKRRLRVPLAEAFARADR